MKNNPDYKGPWSAPLIDNPDYKGPWAPRKIPNPNYFEDQAPIKSLPKIVRSVFLLHTVCLSIFTPGWCRY
jgi:hypothetical protein